MSTTHIFTFSIVLFALTGCAASAADDGSDVPPEPTLGSEKPLDRPAWFSKRDSCMATCGADFQQCDDGVDAGTINKTHDQCYSEYRGCATDCNSKYPAGTNTSKLLVSGTGTL